MTISDKKKFKYVMIGLIEVITKIGLGDGEIAQYENKYYLQNSSNLWEALDLAYIDHIADEVGKSR